MNRISPNRRHFLKQLALSAGALAAAAHAGPHALAQSARDWKSQIGLELFTVRDLLRSDYEGTLAKVAEIGYKQVEPADPYNHLGPDAYKALLDKYGLKMFSTHSGGTDGPDLEKQLEGFQLMGLKYTEVHPGRQGGRGPRTASGPGERGRGGRGPGEGGRGPGTRRPARTVESVKAECAELNHYGAIVKKFGMKILIHNHAGEFDLLDDEKTTQYDLLLSETDPELVAMQLDIGWAYIAGQDALAMFQKNPGRYELWHVKDVRYKQLDPKMTPSQRGRVGKIVTMGEGDVDYKAIFAKADQAGMKHFVIEQDTAGQDGRDAIEDCRIAYKNLNRLLGA